MKECGIQVIQYLFHNTYDRIIVSKMAIMQVRFESMKREKVSWN